MVTQLLLAVLLAAPLAAGQAPATGKVYKSQDGGCQVTVPADWKTDEFAATDPAKTLSINVFHPEAVKVEVKDPAFLKAVYDAEKVFENTPQRLFVQSRTAPVGPVPAKTKWQSHVPSPPQGACQVIVIFEKGASESVARPIVMSLKPSK